MQTTAEPSEAPPRPCLTLGELGGIIGVVALASVGTASLALAQLGHHNGWLALALGLGFTAATAALAALVDGRVSVTFDRAELVLLAGTFAAALVFFFPGFRYAYADKDPGVYVAQSFAIAREGNVDIRNPVEAAGLPHGQELHQFFSGVNEGRAPDSSTSQFYHYYPATLATADDLAGSSGVFQIAPVLATASLALFVLATRRAAGTAVAAIISALLVTSMMQVWQARYPSTEMLSQLLLSGALLAAVLALERRWATGAFVAGLLSSAGFLVRPDGFLYILVGAGVLALVIAAGSVDRRAVALGIGLAVPLPYAFWNAYVARSLYSSINSVPSSAVLLAACVGLLGAGWAVAAARRRAALRDKMPWLRRDWRAEWRRWQLVVGGACTLGFAALLAVFWFRRRLFGSSDRYSAIREEWTENLNVDNLRTLALFVTKPGLALAVAGVAVLLLSRSKLSLYVLVLPGIALLPVYLWDARISMRLMWWARRFVPAVLPALLLLTALGLAWAMFHRWRPDRRPERLASTGLRLAGGAGTVVLVAAFAGQSLPLRDHHEMRGSWDAAESIASVAGDRQGVFLYGEYPDHDVLHPLRNTPAVLWWVFDETTASLPEELDAGTVEAYAEAFPGQPVYLVLADEEGFPPELPADRFDLVDEIAVDLEWLEETTAGGPDITRPEETRSFTWNLTIWQLAGT